MKTKKTTLHSIFNHLAEEAKTPAQIDLWPSIQSRLLHMKTFSQEQENIVGTQIIKARRMRFGGAIILAILVTASFLLVTPQGNVWAQALLQFFTHTGSDALPVQAFQLTPIPESTSPDPGDINNANQTVAEIEQQAGYNVLEPGWLPGGISIVGATFEPEHHVARIFYRDAEGNALVVKEAPFQQSDDCELCSKVGASAPVEEVQIGSTQGEYVEGVWKLTDSGSIWVPDPYLKTLRWQTNGMTFEILYMGQPDSVTKADLAAVAESIH